MSSKEPDMRELLDNQLKIQQMLENDIASIDFRKQTFLGMFEEIAETMRHLPIKSHKIHQETNIEEAQREAADVFIYFMNLWLSLGGDSSSLMYAVEAKQQVNLNRIKNKY